ncbi:MAG: hypothetical protein JST92_03990 [Deltaproteobacteria bacterium]|nr:hypothetical protein [Deltaproteobacteria bacterium]
MLNQRRTRWTPGLLSALCAACAAAPKPVAQPPPESPIQGIQMDDTLHGVRFELPPAEGGWQAAHEGAAEMGAGVQVEVAGFPLAKPANPGVCRTSARARLAQGRPPKDDAELMPVPPERAEVEVVDGLRDQQLTEAPTASWSFTRGKQGADVRSRWAFYSRGADCLLLEVTGKAGDPFGDLVFRVAARSFQLTQLAPERQREIDLLAGMGFLERREPTAALDRFEALTVREPSYTKGHFGALMAAFEIGPSAYPRGLAHGDAVLHAERELSSEQRQLALRTMGVIQLAQNRLKDAAETLAELVVRAPDLAEGQYNYACALARLGNSSGALDHLRAALQLDETFAAHARTDDDLAALRGNPAFEQLLHDRSSSR